MVANLQFPGLFNNGRKFVAPHIRVGLTVYPTPDLEEIPFRPKRGMGVRQIDWNGQESEASILQLSWSKQIGQPSGQWSARVKGLPFGADGELLLDFDNQDIGDNDWVDLAILRNGVRIPVCRGVVDSVRRQSRSVGGATSVVYSVTGRDHGAFFEYPITWNSLWARTLNEIVSGLFTSRADGKVGGRPDELFASLIEGTFRGGTKQGVPSGQWILPQSLEDLVGPGKSKLFDLLEVITFNADKGIKGLRGAYYNEPQLWTIGEQPLHQTLSQWVNPLLNEYWYDILPPEVFLPKHGLNGFLSASQITKGTISTDPQDLFIDDSGIGQTQRLDSEDQDFGSIGAFIRERPFPTTDAGKDSMWFSLPTWTLPTWLLESVDLGRSGAQRFNLFELLGDFGLGPQQEQAAFSKPRWHKANIFTHGLRSYSQSTRFFAQNKGGPGAWFEERDKWLRILVDWFAPNPYLLQGQVVAKVPLPEIRVGHRVILDDGGGPQRQIQAYVEGVTTTVNAPTQEAGARGSTTLILTRGFQGTDEELISAVSQMSDLYQGVF